jgi:hypothetical protein
MKTYNFSYHLPISRLHHIGKTKRISRRFLLIPTDCFTIPGSTPKRNAVGSIPIWDASQDRGKPKNGAFRGFCYFDGQIP